MELVSYNNYVIIYWQFLAFFTPIERNKIHENSKHDFYKSANSYSEEKIPSKREKLI